MRVLANGSEFSTWTKRILTNKKAKEFIVVSVFTININYVFAFGAFAHQIINHKFFFPPGSVMCQVSSSALVGRPSKKLIFGIFFLLVNTIAVIDCFYWLSKRAVSML